MKRWLLMPVLLACAGLAVAITLWVVGLRGQLRRLGAEASELGDRARQSEMLAGLMDQLRRQSEGVAGPGLPVPEHRPLAAEQFPQLEEVFREPAAATGVALSEFKVDVESLGGDYRQLRVEVAVSGPQPSIRAYLLEVCRVPCLLRLQSVSLRRADESQMQMVIGLVLDLS